MLRIAPLDTFSLLKNKSSYAMKGSS